MLEPSLEMSGLFLRHLAAGDPEAEHIMIRDQAAFHPRAELRALPVRGHLMPLPVHNPELNPTEAVGGLIKNRTSNMLLEQFAEDKTQPPLWHSVVREVYDLRMNIVSKFFESPGNLI